MTVHELPSAGPGTVILVSTRAVLTQPDDSLLMSPATITVSPITGKIVSIVPEVVPRTSFPPSTIYVDHGSKLLLPGLVDAHVHLNEPGRTEWEGFWTGTRAAASGGVTTVIDMPLNAIPPTTTVEGFREKLAASRGQCWVDVGFYGGVIPGNADQLLPLVEMGVRGFKGFLIESGVEEFPAVSSTDIALAMTTLKDAPTTLMFHAEMIPPISDSVGDAVQQSQPPLAPHGDLSSYNTFLESRPPSFETYAIDEIISLAPLAPRLPLHIVHLSATQCIPILKAARRAGVRITAETCFHYLGLCAEDVEDGDTRHKCCPPIRESANRDGLWEELTAEDSCIRTVVSDHSPCTPELKLLPDHLSVADRADAGALSHIDSAIDFHTVKDSLAVPEREPHMHHSDSGIDIHMRGSRTQSSGDGSSSPTSSQHSDSGTDLSMPPSKAEAAAALTEIQTEAAAAAASDSEAKGDFFAAWGGISSVGLGLPILHTAALRRRDAGSTSAPTVLDMVRLCSQATAAQVGLSHRKGGLKVGLDADVCVFDDAATWTLHAGDMRWKNRCSPWEGREFVGRVAETWLRGRRVFALGGRNAGFVGGAPIGEAIVEKRVA